VKRSMARPKPTVLIDTNMLVSGLVFLKGNEHRILKLAEDKRIALVLPEFVLDEARMVLARRFPDHEALLDAFLSKTEHQVLPSKKIELWVPLAKNGVRDSKDVPVLASVLVAKPDFTITGDIALREDMRRCRESARVTNICSSRQFLKKALKKQR
jgi:putative PIN family toxin of toxin-antitoxin system